jgi:DNA-binding LacI/PurR family transcriptional regulator
MDLPESQRYHSIQTIANRAGRLIPPADWDRVVMMAINFLKIVPDIMKRKLRSAQPLRPAPKRRKPVRLDDGKLQMQDIAHLAGVSTSTVSRALNHSSLVNVETRERIAQLARKLKYSINVSASNLRMQRNRTVAVVLPFDSTTRQHVSDPFFVSLLGGLADALTARGYDMLLSRIDADRLDLAGDLAASGRAIGVILIGQWHHHDQLNVLAAHHSPMVVWGAQLTNQLYCTIGGDNIAGGMLATEHLLDKRRRRIAFFGDVELPEIGHRFEGYQRALAERKVTAIPELVLQTPFIEGSARAAIDKLLNKTIRFDAIFASSDLLAMEAIGALRERSLRVPDDVSVVGYDDIVLSRYCHPSLTTIRQPVISGGEALVDALLKIVDKKRPKSQILPTELIVRESSR